MSDPFLPEPPEAASDAAQRREIDDLEDDVQPDLEQGAGDSPDEVDAAARAAEPGVFRTPRPGDRLSPEQLESELD